MVDSEGDLPVPIQPDFMDMPGYRSKVAVWNPGAQKGEALFYEFHTGPRGKNITLYPDACANYLIRCGETDPAVLVMGLQTVAVSIPLEPGRTYFGFKPYSVVGMRDLGFSWRDLVDRRTACFSSSGGGLDAADIAGVARAPSFENRMAAMRALAAGRLADECCRFPGVAREELKACAAMGDVRVDALLDGSPLSDRSCRRAFVDTVGIGAKLYTSIIRFQGVLRELCAAPRAAVSLTNVAYRTGYSDQAHLSREFRRFAGESPSSFLCHR